MRGEVHKFKFLREGNQIQLLHYLISYANDLGSSSILWRALLATAAWRVIVNQPPVAQVVSRSDSHQTGNITATCEVVSLLEFGIREGGGKISERNTSKPQSLPFIACYPTCTLYTMSTTPRASNAATAKARASCTRCYKRKKRCDRTLPACENCGSAYVRCSFLDDDHVQTAAYSVA